MFNFIDTIVTFEPGECAEGHYQVTADHHSYLVPSTAQLNDTLLLEAIGQLNAWITMELNDFQVRPVAVLYGAINFYGHAFLNDKLTVKTELMRIDEDAAVFNGCIMKGERVLLEVNDAVGSFLEISEFDNSTVNKKKFEQLCGQGFSSKNSVSVGQQEEDIFNYDKIIVKIAEKKIVGVKEIKKNYNLFKDHFPKKPVLPISILLQNNINLCYKLIRLLTNKDNFQLTKLMRIKMRDFILPNSTVHCEVRVKQQLNKKVILIFENIINKKSVCQGLAEFSLASIFSN